MKTWTFSRRVGVSIAAASLVVAIFVSGFVYFTFRHWNAQQEAELLETQLKQFAQQLGEVSFLPSLLQPGKGEGTGVSAVFKPDLAAFAEDLHEGQRLQLLDSDGHVLVEMGAHPDERVRYEAERSLHIPVYGAVTLRLADLESSRSAVAEREIGRLLLVGLGLAAGLALVIGRIAAHSAVRPIRGMVLEIKEIGADNLSRRLPLPASRDELYQLGEAFNSLLHRLNLSFEQQRRFVADASHELKTPIAIIEGHTRMIQRWGSQSQDVVEESLTYMVDETERMKQLVAQLLLLAEAEEPLMEGEETACNLRHVLGEMLPQMLHVNPGVTLNGSEEAAGEALSVRMPAGACYQTVRNIIENAFKYTPPGGEVGITIRQEDNYTVLVVADNGIGISEEQLPHIFERFYRAEGSRNRNRGGSGLGLAITAALMKRYKGSIEVASSPGEGTAVTLRYVRVH
ncbi:HAMP domain-containing histidine kinase [Paenibacillus sp. HN-1]|uniref:sensor histidine kinase n=1 Tax=Paenibacillus TaxID=44249 RepID=UPI001CA9EF38|nr:MULTISPECIES: HAMP domain-containing sensor histidine kinase [Paenibacillus]MBY9080067.1 HAMP domain-containing histidine kinase [Paenibacillus sp. CGMCC 1.18879]MBY9086765.1 HAMP domain-containing histidine kinase [Paenibacillus sinensis]